MLAYCLVDGLTCNQKVYRRGDIFILSSSLTARFGSFDVVQLGVEQKKVFNRELFRFPSSEEIIAAYELGHVTMSDLSGKEKHIVVLYKESQGARVQEAAKVLREQIEEAHPEFKEVSREIVKTELDSVEEIVQPVVVQKKSKSLSQKKK